MTAPRTRVQRRPVHGVLLLDKPLGLSSNDALQKVKWLLRAQKAGHTGTLDPLATGVLPLCFGAATKFSALQLEAPKTYVAVARLGQTTTTADAEGEILEQRPVDQSVQTALEPQNLSALAKRFTGNIAQVPPMYSALKKDGKALYEYARAGQEVAREPRQITIHALALVSTTDEEGQPALHLEVTCSKGTYIRTLAEDIGAALGCGAHLRSLRRTSTGGLDLERCVTLSELEALEDEARLTHLLPVDSLLRADKSIGEGIGRIELGSEDAGRFLTGLRRRGAWPDMPAAAVYAQDGMLLGLAHVQAGELIPDRLLSPIEIEQIKQQIQQQIK